MEGSCEVPPRIDRARTMRRDGSVLTVDMEALRHVLEEKNADQQQRVEKAAVDCDRDGSAQTSRPNRHKNRLERREKERTCRECLRDKLIVTQVLTKPLNSIKDGSGSIILATTGRLRGWQQSAGTPSSGKGNTDSVNQDSQYVGIVPLSSDRTDTEIKKEKERIN